ncbi:hypothetical protein HanXRQr2_Chr15g0673501 [Helianthus annuus]|uniref:Uncharacterized protein n=1 Tax=Helianthus annuus TaxID=4232 RepID=A0A9K3H0M7_HELAN|nr:hypothetical protein HanXRQr2_Chr15g0673501 [Helianthus annuus]
MWKILLTFDFLSSETVSSIYAIHLCKSVVSWSSELSIILLTKFL